MAFAVPWTLSSICVIILTGALTGSKGRTIDQDIVEAKKTSNVAVPRTNSVVTVEYDILLNAEDLAELNKEQIPLDDDEDESEGPRRQSEGPRRRHKDTFSAQERQRRNAVRNLSRRWTNKVMPYTFQPGAFNVEQRRLIDSAIDDYNLYTCLKLVPRTNETVYVRFQNGVGCSSFVGMSKRPQPINLGMRCRTKPIILHEIGHAAGFFHEHKRPDRDNYVRILRENIAPFQDFNFAKFTSLAINTYNVSYDYESVMHYGQYTFSKNGKRTIETLDPTKQNVIGKSEGLSFRDVKLLNLMYECKPSLCADKQCPGEGYVGKDCKCYCPGNPVTECVECKDKKKRRCNRWAAIGRCTKKRYKKYMERKCRKACKLCD